MATIYAHCPACKAENALTIRVGKKSTSHTAACPVCRAAFDYSAWITKKTADGMVFHQVDLFPAVATARATCKACGATFKPTYGEHARCASCLAAQHAAAERAGGVE